MPLAVDTSTPSGSRGAPGVEVAGEHARAARAADQAGQLGLVDAAVLLDLELLAVTTNRGNLNRPGSVAETRTA